MIEKLIKKVVEDAEEKAQEIIEKAENECLELFALEKKAIEREYGDRLRLEKERIDGENARKIAGFRMESEKELLALKNSFIEEVMKKLEKRFYASLNEDIWDIVASFCREIKEKNCRVTVPESAGDVEISGVKVIKDRDLKDAFIVSTEKWKIAFTWDRIRDVLGDELRENIGRQFIVNGKENLP